MYLLKIKRKKLKVNELNIQLKTIGKETQISRKQIINKLKNKLIKWKRRKNMVKKPRVTLKDIKLSNF